MTLRRVAWGALHACLVALAVLCFDLLILKFDRPWADRLPLLLATTFILVLVLRRLARAVPGERRNGLESWWASLDAVGLVWIAFLFVLIVDFRASFQRVSGDGREYFAQLRSLVIDRDLDFANEAKEFAARYAPGFPFGSAILWLPFYLAAHAWLWILNAVGSDLRQDGYFYPYQMAIGLGTLVYGFTGLLLIYRIASDYFSRWLSLSATAVVAAGSFVYWYLTADNSYTHGNSLFAVTLFLFIWHRTRASRSLTAWALLGLSGGVMMMVRWQSAVFLAPLGIDVLEAGWRSVQRGDRGTLIHTARGAAVAGGGVLIGFLPQMIFWKIVNGGYFALPHFQAGQQWWGDPVMTDVLFSSNHGLFAWHPVLYLSALGAPLVIKRDARLGWLLVFFFLAQVYINSAVTTWWGGSAFGGRRFDGCMLFFALGLAAFIQWSSARPAVLWAGVLAAFVGANVLFMQEIAAGRLPTGEGIAADRLFGIVFSRLGNPFSFPANAWFAWRHGTTASFYDRLGLHLYTNVSIDLGEEDDERFLAQGWAGRESGRYGTYRWGTGEQSTIAVSLLGPRYVDVDEPQQFDDYTLQFRAAPYVFDGSPPQVTEILVNGKPLGELTLEPGFREYTLDVPPGFLKRSVNVIGFRYSYARSPRELGRQRGDERRLAARFDYIHLRVKPRS